MAETIKVAIVAPGNKPGGQAAQAAFLVRQWSNDPDVRVELAPSDPRFPRPLRALERVPYLRTLVRLFVYFPSIWRNFRRADVVHIFSASYWSCLLVAVPALLVARARKSKVVLHYHSGEAADHLEHWRSAHWLLRQVDCIAVPSPYLAEIFGRYKYAATIVPNGLDDAQFSFRSRVVLEPNMLCSRAFEPYYRVDLVIRAFAAVKQEIPQATLTLAGSGSQEKYLRKLVADMGLRDVVFAGKIENSEIAGFYDRADLWLNASVVDNMPVSILEAFASGCVVISSRAAGIPYMVEDGMTGLLSEPGNVEAMAANVLRVLKTPGLGTRLSEAARHQFRRYRWQQLRPQWVALYRKLLEGGAGVSLHMAESAVATEWRSGVDQP
jgi:glycosyltransferase involved in cell wall biosynthesis